MLYYLHIDSSHNLTSVKSKDNFNTHEKFRFESNRVFFTSYKRLLMYFLLTGPVSASPP